jgi:cysteine desulfurase family protein (TIGR01976 family)
VNRDRFPGLADGWARLDAPGGSQPVDSAIEAIAAFMRSGAMANSHGAFDAADRVDELLHEGRAVVGELLGGDPRGVAFGQSMTTLTLAFAAAVGRTLSEGDEIVCTRLDHDANVSPWLIAARRAGAAVRFAEPDPETLELPASAVEAVLSERTRWVAVTGASNAVGTVPELRAIVEAVHAAGARVYVDAVHATPHRANEVAALDADALACSAYKWFGPHQSILWARPSLLEELRPDKLRPAPDEVPYRWETGTPAFESLAGTIAAARYVLDEVRYDAIRAHEDALLDRMLTGLRALNGVTLYGSPRDRTPTVMFNVAGHTSEEVAKALAAEQVAVWHGNYYAYELERYLDLAPDGAVRAGIVHYNDEEDVDRLLAGVARLAGS